MGCQNVVANHLSWLIRDIDKDEIKDSLLDEQLMAIEHAIPVKGGPWFANLIN